jgi:hypothetical protein
LVFRALCCAESLWGCDTELFTVAVTLLGVEHGVVLPGVANRPAACCMGASSSRWALWLRKTLWACDIELLIVDGKLLKDLVHGMSESIACAGAGLGCRSGSILSELG